MQIVIFTYNREEKLRALMLELESKLDGKRANILVIDDGSDWVGRIGHRVGGCELIRFPHTGKKGFYKKWDFAIDYCLESNHNDFLFLADDVTNVNMDMITKLTKQGWGNSLLAVNVVNDGRTSCWGTYSTGQEPLKIGKLSLKEVGFVDCGFLSNRATMSRIKIDRVKDSWFDRSDKSSGVGHQLTTKMRRLGVKMLNPTPSLCYHGDHKSEMHGEHRKDMPLISK